MLKTLICKQGTACFLKMSYLIVFFFWKIWYNMRQKNSCLLTKCPQMYTLDPLMLHSNLIVCRCTYKIFKSTIDTNARKKNRTYRQTRSYTYRIVSQLFFFLFFVKSSRTQSNVLTPIRVSLGVVEAFLYNTPLRVWIGLICTKRASYV